MKGVREADATDEIISGPPTENHDKIRIDNDATYAMVNRPSPEK